MATKMQKIDNYVRYAAYVLALFMGFMGIQKFIGDVPIFAIIERNTGVGFVEPYLRYLAAIAEIAAALLIFLGRRIEGAVLATLILLGAVFAHLTVLGVNTPVSGAPDAAESPMLFIMAVVFLVYSAFLTLFIWRTRRAA